MPTKRALITGASQGLGLEFARQLSANGWQITAVSRGRPPLPGLRWLRADLATPRGLKSASAELAKSPYQLLVNNAGIAAKGSFAGSPLAVQLRLIDLNVRALTVLSHAYLRRARPGD